MKATTPLYFALVALVALRAGVVARMAGRLAGGFGFLPSAFSCHDKPVGYYADVEHRCRAYHVCSPVYAEDGTVSEIEHYTFMCGQGAVFNQDTLTCAHPIEALPCQDAPAHYIASNAEVGIIPEKNVEVNIESMKGI